MDVNFQQTASNIENVMIKGKLLRAMIDTGSPINLMTENLETIKNKKRT